MQRYSITLQEQTIEGPYEVTIQEEAICSEGEERGRKRRAVAAGNGDDEEEEEDSDAFTEVPEMGDQIWWAATHLAPAPEIPTEAVRVIVKHKDHVTAFIQS